MAKESPEREGSGGGGEVNEEDLVEAIASTIDANDEDAEQKARIIADILVHLSTSKEEGGEEDIDEEPKGGTGKQAKRFSLNDYFGPVSRLPRGRCK